MTKIITSLFLSFLVPFTVSSQCMTTGDFESPEWTTQVSGNWTMTTSEGDWEANSAYVNTGAVNSGANKFGMNATGDYLVTPQYTNPATLQFWVRTSSDPDDWTLDIQYSTSPTGSWTTHSTVTECSSCAIDNNYSQVSVNLNLTGNYYIRFYVSSRSAGSIYIDDITLSCGAACSSADDVTGAAASAGIGEATISWIAPSCFEEFMIVGVMNSTVSVSPLGDGSLYTSNTSFGAGTDVGTNEFDVYEGTGTSATITGLATGENYCFRIFTRTGTTWNSGVEVCVTPIDASQISYVNGTLVNSCGSSAEGTSEMVTIQVGGADLNWNDISITFPNGGTYCNSCSQTWATNSAYVNTYLESDCPSGDLIYEMGIDGDVVPSGERLVIFSGSPPDYDYDFSSLCESGPIYVMFADNTSTSGRFANAANDYRTLSYTLSGYSGSVTYYSSTANTGSDGDFVSYDINGTATYMNQCTPNAIIALGINAISLEAIKQNESTLLMWNTIDEELSLFAVERSTNGKEWEEVIQLSGKEFTDKYPYDGMNYYRIVQMDGVRHKQYSNIEMVNFKENRLVKSIYPNPAENEIHVAFNSLEVTHTISILTITGQQVIRLEGISAAGVLDISSLSSGVYFLSVSDGATTEYTKIQIN